MKAINWVDDVAAMAVADRLGLTHTTMTISVTDVDRGKSSENRARDVPLDESRLEGISHSCESGIPIPKIFVRITNSGAVIAGGNHRFNGLPKWVHSLPVHAVECTDAEFEVFCRALNTVVGVGMSQLEKIRAAVDAVERIGMTRAQAAEIYGLSAARVSSAVRHQANCCRVARLVPSAAGKMLATHFDGLGDLANNDNILAAAATMVAKSKIGTGAFKELTKEARQKATEAEQVEVFRNAAAPYEKGKVVDVPRRVRKKFLTALANMEAIAEKKTWSALEMESSEIKATQKRLRAIANYLICLCEAAG